MKAMKIRPLAGLVAGAALTAGVVFVASPAQAADVVVLSKGHTDAIDVHYDEGALKLRVHDDTVSPSVTRDPADVTFQVLPAAETPVPDLPQFSFLGAAGTPVWMLPQVQDPALLWPGWNTTTLSSGVFVDNKITMSLVGVDGPGEVTLFDTNSLGTPNIKFRSSDGLPDALSVPVHTHAHASWAFSKTGRYTLKFQADATLAAGGQLSTGPVDYHFVVGALTDGGEEGVNLSVSGMSEGEYPVGEQVTLQAVQTPQGVLTTYQWFSRRPGQEDFTAVEGETAASYSFTATRALNGNDYLVKLYDGTKTAATSEPVTLFVAFPDEGGGSSAAKAVTASINEAAGALVISVNPDDRTVVLPAAALSTSGDRWETTGKLRPVTVTDTRSARPGWTASGQVANGFTTADGQSFSGSYLGWTPTIITQGAQQGVVAGPVAEPYVVGQNGTGLGGSAMLATAAPGTGRGTAHLDADLKLSVPTETATGTYTGALTLTAI
jgi:surface-anchored protein